MSNYDQVFWLTMTNIILGLVTLACLVIIGYTALREIRKRAMKALPSVAEDDHTLIVTGLGITMADGGKKQGDDEMLVVTEDGIETVKSTKKSRSS